MLGQWQGSAGSRLSSALVRKQTKHDGGSQDICVRRLNAIIGLGVSGCSGGFLGRDRI